jgi:hypothetical protein
MSKTPLIHKLAGRKEIPVEILTITKPIYDPITQKSKYSLGGKTTSCARGTDGTEPKNEADHVMDD